MALSGVLTALADGFTPLNTNASAHVTGPEGLWPAIIAHRAAFSEQGSPLVVVTATTRDADDLDVALHDYLSPDDVVVFPPWETLPHERLSPRPDTIGRRVAVLRRLAHPELTEAAQGMPQVVIVPVRAVMQPIVRGLGDLEPIQVTVGHTYSRDDLIARLSLSGYERVDMVERRGQYAVRGGIIDLFPATLDHPVRIDFFGDEVEEIREFAVADQRSLGTTDHIWAPPVTEVPLTDDVKQRAAQLVDMLPSASDMLTKISEGVAVEGIESLAPVLVDGMELLIDLLPSTTHVLTVAGERVSARATDLAATSAEFRDAAWAVAADGAQTPLELEHADFWELDDVTDRMTEHGMTLSTLSVFESIPDGDEHLDAAFSQESATDKHVVTLDAKPVVGFRGDINSALDDITKMTAAGMAVVMTTKAVGAAQRTTEQLREAGASAVLVEDLAEAPAPGTVTVTTAHCDTGFRYDAAQLALITDTDLLGKKGAASTRDMRRMPSRRRREVDPLTLSEGDYIVHETHGVGRFISMEQRTIGGAKREYLVIEYAPSKRSQPTDRVYVPTDSLDQISRYVGGEAPSLNKLGGSDWAKTKAKARKAVKEIAAELIRLYAARMATPGHQYGPDTPWQGELEDAFAHIETPDQLATIDEVKSDMEKPIPMDRLICGDVGYGKTEIAVRAAFKAIQDSKQVAVLVPTTILVQQHTETFTERFAPFPIKVASLSRFQTDKEAQQVISGLADGSIDLVIGTHRLLSKEIKFKDLGMVVIDEEQRFGVEHKEQLKALRAAVDVLAMSATPIPRTLEMAITGIREMSTLATPPEERHPILTYVGPYDNAQIAAAIRREMLRDGQVFFIHNRVQSIEKAAVRIRELVPNARVAIAHGQMSENMLEQTIVDFYQGEYDVLVCTTIIETGIDISNANTLIVERADMFGLSQLHQIRGRVGRGRERAYAYFLYPPEAPLKESAHERLSTVAQHTDLGAGMAVAMKDLEIRGAGNLLGGQQSGHIEGVGFDLYVRMVGQAVADFRGDEDTEPVEIKIELPVDAHLPEDYLPHERLRLEAYRKLAIATTDSAVDDVVAELHDRYGELPEPVQNLVAVARLRVLARQVGVTEIQLLGNKVRFAPAQLRDSQQVRLKRLYPSSLYKAANDVALIPAPRPKKIGGEPIKNLELLDWARDVLRDIFDFANPAP